MESLFCAFSGFICEFGTSSIESKILYGTNLLPSIFFFLSALIVATLLFGYIIDKFCMRIIRSFVDKYVDLFKKGTIAAETQRISRKTVNKLLEIKLTKFYFQSAIIFAISSPILVSASEHTYSGSLWLLFFFELSFGILIFGLAAFFDSKKLTYPTGFSFSNQSRTGFMYVQIHNPKAVRRRDRVFVRIVNNAFYAWMVATILIMLFV